MFPKKQNCGRYISICMEADQVFSKVTRKLWDLLQSKLLDLITDVFESTFESVIELQLALLARQCTAD